MGCSHSGSARIEELSKERDSLQHQLIEARVARDDALARLGATTKSMSQTSESHAEDADQFASDLVLDIATIHKTAETTTSRLVQYSPETHSLTENNFGVGRANFTSQETSTNAMATAADVFVPGHQICYQTRGTLGGAGG